MSFLDVSGKTFLVFGVANRRSVAYHTARILEEAGATVVFSVRSPERQETVAKLLEGREVHVCDVDTDSLSELAGSRPMMQVPVGW